MEETRVNEGEEQRKNTEINHNVQSLLSSADRDFLIRNNGQQGSWKKEQSLKSILVDSHSRDFVISADGKKIPVSELEGKIIGLYFSMSSNSSSSQFTSKLIEVYKKLKEKGEEFEVVMIPLDEDEEIFKQDFGKLPWFSLPCKDTLCRKLAQDFELSGLPTLVIIGSDGKILHLDVTKSIEEHGDMAYPFTPEKFIELEAIEKAKLDTILYLQSLLSSSDRDFLIRNNGDQVKIESLKGKKVGLYYSASWCRPVQKFTLKLIKVYDEVSSKGDFEIVFVSSDDDDESFEEIFSGMPWLAIPFSEIETRDKLVSLFEVMGIPSLVILDQNGKVSTTDGVKIIQEYGVDAYPFTSEKIRELKGHKERARREQSLKSILVSPSRDFVVSADGKKVFVSELEGKTIGLYFSISSYSSSSQFTTKLVKVYKKLKEKGEDFEVVMIPLDDDKKVFDYEFGKLPWFSLPFKDELCWKLSRYFERSGLPTLVIIGPDGKTLHLNVAETIKEHGHMAYPFTLEAIEKAKREAQTLGSILVSGGLDFVIGKNGIKVKIDSLKGKEVGLYFSASWSGPCQRFTPKLVEFYNEVSSRGDFEIVFVSAPGDEDDESFKEYFSEMPWLAIPFSDSETSFKLDVLFKVTGIPSLVILDKNGKVLTTDGVEIIQEYGLDVYPFSSERIRELKEQTERAKREQSLKSILVSLSRDFVISADGKKVFVSELEGKTIGLYFLMSSYIPSSQFTPKLVEVYKKLKEKGEEFEVVMIPLDEDEEIFIQDFGKLPWFSLPFEDELCGKLVRYFELSDLPTLVIIGPDGKTLHLNVAETIKEHGDMAYPFTLERFTELEAIEKAKREAQTLEPILILGDLDFMIGKNGIKVKIDSMKGKRVGLYFSASWCGPCHWFTPKLVEAYNEVSSKGDFEIVFVSSDKDDESFKEYFNKMPWLAIPFSDSETRDKLASLFKVMGIPSLVILDQNGKVSTTDGVKLIQEYGVDAYPFTSERIRELKGHEERARREQSLKSILVSPSRDFVVSADGKKVPISDLVGKHILLYFSARSCPPCRVFMPKLVEAYHQIKAKDDNFEVIFISSDSDETEFEGIFAKMPWLALPFGDDRKENLSRIFKVRGRPMVVALDPTGKTITTKARELLMTHGAEVYPFTDARLKEIEAKYDEMAKGWPEKVKHELHEHELTLGRHEAYRCDGCDEDGKLWSFICEECEFYLHPKCALKEIESKDEDEEKAKEGWVCDGEVCSKA